MGCRAVCAIAATEEDMLFLLESLADNGWGTDKGAEL